MCNPKRFYYSALHTWFRIHGGVNLYIDLINIYSVRYHIKIQAIPKKMEIERLLKTTFIFGKQWMFKSVKKFVYFLFKKE